MDKKEQSKMCMYGWKVRGRDDSMNERGYIKLGG